MIKTLSLFLFAVSALAQNLSLGQGSAPPPAGGYPPGATVILNVTKTLNPTATALQFDIATTAGTLAFGAGAAVSGNKQLTCATQAPFTCILYATNTTPIPDGVVVVISITLPTTVNSSPITVSISNPVEADGNGGALPVSIGNPSVSLPLKNGCDVNSDGTVSSADQMAVVNIAILRSTTVTTDLNKDGKTNVLDVQIVGTALTPPNFICNAK